MKSPSVQRVESSVQNEIEVRHQREGDMDKTAVPDGAVNLGRVIDVPRNRHSPSEEDQVQNGIHFQIYATMLIRVRARCD